MPPCNFKDLRSTAGGERIGTENDHALVCDHLVQMFFIARKIMPVALGKPGFISIYAHACVTVGESLAQLLFPASDDSLGVEYAINDIPPGMRNDFDIAGRKVTGRTGKSLEQSQSRLLFTEWIKDDPDTEFVAFESCLEKGDKDVQKVLPCFVEMAEVRTPFHASNGRDTGLSLLIHH